MKTLFDAIEMGIARYKKVYRGEEDNETFMIYSIRSEVSDWVSTKLIKFSESATDIDHLSLVRFWDDLMK